eukprot:6834540-Prymnesium_polylepis.1
MPSSDGLHLAQPLSAASNPGWQAHVPSDSGTLGAVGTRRGSAPRAWRCRRRHWCIRCSPAPAPQHYSSPSAATRLARGGRSGLAAGGLREEGRRRTR